MGTRERVLERKTALEVFLTERYCLYEVRMGVVWWTEIQHEEWKLQRGVEPVFEEYDAGEVHGLPLVGEPELVHFCRDIEVLVWPPREGLRFEIWNWDL